MKGNETLSAIAWELSKLQNTLDAMGVLCDREEPKAYQDLSMDAAMRGERMAVKLRDLVFSSTSQPRADYLGRAADAQGIQVAFEEGVFHAVLPRQMPRRRWKNTAFLTQPLAAAMSNLAQRQELPLFSDCVVCFVHIYERGTPVNLTRDHDNVESKQILDVLSAYLLEDDNGLFCDLHHRVEQGEDSHCEVYLMERSRFFQWLFDRKNTENDRPK